MVMESKDTMIRNYVALTLGIALLLLVAIHTLATSVNARTAMPDLEGSWSARIMEPGVNGLVEETGGFDITFLEGNRFASETPSGLQGEGTYEVSRGRLLRLKGAQGEEVYSILPLSESVLTIYREGNRKAIYLVRN